MAARKNERLGTEIMQRVKRLGKMIRYQRRSVNRIKKLVMDLQKWQNEANGFCCDKRHYLYLLTLMKNFHKLGLELCLIHFLWQIPLVKKMDDITLKLLDNF